MKKILVKILILILLFIILMVNISIAVPGKLNDSNVRVRNGPSTEGTKTLTNLYLNDPVEVIEKTGDWYKVKTKSGIIGYIFAQYVDVKGDVPIAGVEKPKKVVKPKVEKPKEAKPKVEEPKVEEPKVEEPKVEEIDDGLPRIKLAESLKGKYMPFMYSSNKVTYKKGETLKILDEKALWTKVKNNTQESWVLTSKIIVEVADTVE